MDKIIRVHSILFTEACPLNCRYCDLKNGLNFGEAEPFNYDEIRAQIQYYDEQDTKDNVQTKIVFTGGEPLLYWEYIKQIILEYGDKFQYEFNTSGYLLTEEILEFLSKYQSVNFYLSVDGNEALTNYLRPTKDKPYHTGYFKQFKQNVPTLLYYYPMIPFKIIISPRYVDLLHEQYLEAAKLGFKFFYISLDFESRPTPQQKIITKVSNIIWNETHTQILREQVNLILKDICLGFKNNISYPRVTNLDAVINYLINKQDFNPYTLPCQVFEGRTLMTMYQRKLDNYCMTKAYPKQEDAVKRLCELQEKHKCRWQEDCPAFDFCIQTGCPQYAITDPNTEYFYLDELDCATNRVFYDAGLQLLFICNNMCPDAILYKNYIATFLLKGKVENNGHVLPL